MGKKISQNNLIGSDPRTAPLQLRAAIALSACKAKIKAWKSFLVVALNRSCQEKETIRLANTMIVGLITMS